MKRRQFLGSSLAASAMAATASSVLAQEKETSGSSKREFYELRRYQLANGPQRKLTDDYFRDALVPALNRMQINPVGVFNVTIGPVTPAMYVLMPCISADKLVTAEGQLLKDADYMKAAAPFLSAPGKEPAFARLESSLMRAYEKMPKINLPAASTSRSPRVFELRTYESPSDQDHWRKIEQMSSGEDDIFTKVGIPQVFYGDTVIGPRLPNITYMLCFDNMAERDKRWDAFRSSPEWKALSSDPRFAYEDIVSNITNIILTPTAYSQI